jgi:hypothetical protein
VRHRLRDEIVERPIEVRERHVDCDPCHRILGCRRVRTPHRPPPDSGPDERKLLPLACRGRPVLVHAPGLPDRTTKSPSPPQRQSTSLGHDTRPMSPADSSTVASGPAGVGGEARADHVSLVGGLRRRSVPKRGRLLGVQPWLRTASHRVGWTNISSSEGALGAARQLAWCGDNLTVPGHELARRSARCRRPSGARPPDRCAPR